MRYEVCGCVYILLPSQERRERGEKKEQQRQGSEGSEESERGAIGRVYLSNAYITYEVLNRAKFTYGGIRLCTIKC
jgi:hypothetical protein